MAKTVLSARLTIEKKSKEYGTHLINSQPQSKYLINEEDGLLLRKCQPYARYKLTALETYLSITMKAMKGKPWRAFHYIDLQAGPGKNLIGGEVVLGSPLIALSNEIPFARYFFNDSDANTIDALRQRVSTHSQSHTITTLQEDVNTAVDRVCDVIRSVDSEYLEGRYSSFNIAFLDPEGLELHWETIEKLAKMKRMDLIINFSTGGINRVISKDNTESVNRFFGTNEWQRAYQRSSSPTMSSENRRKLIDLYLGRLREFDYHVEEDPDIPMEIAVKNSRNVQVYSMIFASKHPLGSDFWGKAAAGSSPQQHLPGLD